MKKTLIAVALATGLGLIGIQQASANPGYGGHGMGGPCGKQGVGWQQPDKEAKEKIRTFIADNKMLRKEMVVKRSVRQAIMMSEHPDPEAASKIAGELFDLRQTMREKVETAGIAGLVGPMGPGHPEMSRRMGGQFQSGRFCSGPPAEMVPHPKFGRGPLDPETKAKLDKFRTDNRDLKKKIFMKRAVKQALMRSNKIDYGAVAAVAGDLFDLQSAMREKAIAAGVEQFVRPNGHGRFGQPPHFDMGRHHRGPGRY